VIPYGMWVPVAVRRVANCYTPFTLLYFTLFFLSCYMMLAVFLCYVALFLVICHSWMLSSWGWRRCIKLLWIDLNSGKCYWHLRASMNDAESLTPGILCLIKKRWSWWVIFWLASVLWSYLTLLVWWLKSIWPLYTVSVIPKGFLLWEPI